MLLHGDCLDLMASLEAGTVDMVLSDPPYGTTQNKWDSPVSLPHFWAALARVCKPSAVIALTASQPFASTLVVSNPKMFKHEWVWIKNAGSNFANTVREPMKEHESVLIFSKGAWTYNRQMQERTGGGAARVKTPVEHHTSTDNYGKFSGREHTMMPELRVPSSWQKFNRERGLHPTQKPVGLFEYMMKTYTNPGDLVLDPFAGSGTTAVAALNLGRRYVCCEKDETYFATMQKRVADSNLKACDLFAAE
jgi:site-specific DNA-methyltransferase (adenine-specific)